MKLTARLIALLFIVLIMFLSVSCAPNSIVAPASTPAPTFTSSPTLLPTAVPTATPTPSPTPEPLLSAERKAELNLQITDFINNQGDFTKDKKSKMAIRTRTRESQSTELGLADGLNVFIEGYLFDYFKKDGSLLLLVGFDGKDGKGFVTPVQIPLYFLEGEAKAGYNFETYEDSIDSSMAFCRTTITVAEGTNKDTTGLFVYLDKLEGKVIRFRLCFKKFSGSVDDYVGVLHDYLKERDSKIGLAVKLVDSVATNGMEIDNEDYHLEDYVNYEIYNLKNVDAIENIDLLKVPMMSASIFFFE
ncbi:MAG: hypothetical protein LLF75_01000 [Eubacteriales bacterium]|nr:hypothetical protein [Eubacteriales bacterium]